MFDFFKSFQWSLDNLTPPWGSGVSIYIHIRDNPKAAELPDAPRPRKPNELTWSSGALDGVFGHHMASAKPEEVSCRVQKMLNPLERLVRDATDTNLKSLYDAVVEESILPIADAFQSELSKILPSHKSKLAQIGRYFATEADRREATKFGILLLGVCGNRADAPLLETLVLHDEFTLFAALALPHVTDDREGTLWNIAQRVRGWGRIQVVERPNETRKQEIQAWMLREGPRNEVMDSYLAGICARTGNLHLALDRAEIDRPLLNGAAGIIRALIQGGPADSIDDYQHAPVAIQRYVNHVLKAEDLDLGHFLCVSEILQFVPADEGWEPRSSNSGVGSIPIFLLTNQLFTGNIIFHFSQQPVSGSGLGIHGSNRFRWYRSVIAGELWPICGYRLTSIDGKLSEKSGARGTMYDGRKHSFASAE